MYLFDQGGEWQQAWQNGTWPFNRVFDDNASSCVGYDRPTDVLAGDEHMLSDERVGEPHRRSSFVVAGNPDLAVELDPFVSGATLFQTYTATNNRLADTDMI
ncbi:MAG: hypothetical protein ACJATT_004739 [Myxococcota bacterium]|jgi:hypothetical protein